MRGVEIHSPRTRIVLLAVVLILAPGIVLGYLGFRSIASRAESLRTNYVATVVLVRDRLEAEVDRLESASRRSAGKRNASCSSASSRHRGRRLL